MVENPYLLASSLLQHFTQDKEFYALYFIDILQNMQ